MYGFMQPFSNNYGSEVERVCGEHFTQLVSELTGIIYERKPKLGGEDMQLLLDIVCFLAQGAWNIAVMCGDIESAGVAIKEFVTNIRNSRTRSLHQHTWNISPGRSSIGIPMTCCSSRRSNLICTGPVRQLAHGAVSFLS